MVYWSIQSLSKVYGVVNTIWGKEKSPEIDIMYRNVFYENSTLNIFNQYLREAKFSILINLLDKNELQALESFNN